MPFKSKKQEKYMWAKHPKIAQRWADKYGSYKGRKDKYIKKATLNLHAKKNKRKYKGRTYASKKGSSA